MYICTVSFHCAAYQLFHFHAKVMQILINWFVLSHWWWILTLLSKKKFAIVFASVSKKNKGYSRITVKQTVKAQFVSYSGHDLDYVKP